MRKNVGPSARPGERAHDVLSTVILEREWSWSFKAEMLVTAVTNWTLLYHTCGKSYTANKFWELYSTENYSTIPIWNEKTRGSVWKLKSESSNLGSNKFEQKRVVRKLVQWLCRVFENKERKKESGQLGLWSTGRGRAVGAWVRMCYGFSSGSSAGGVFIHAI